jgi:hypothetical protein
LERKVRFFGRRNRSAIPAAKKCAMMIEKKTPSGSGKKKSFPVKK